MGDLVILSPLIRKLGAALEHRIDSGMKRMEGFFEFELRSGAMTFLVAVELLPPGLEAAEAKAKVVEEWTIHFAITAPIVPGAVECVNVRPLAAKPEGSLKVPKGFAPVLIWKSLEE